MQPLRKVNVSLETKLKVFLGLIQERLGVPLSTFENELLTASYKAGWSAHGSSQLEAKLEDLKNSYKDQNENHTEVTQRD